MAGILKNNNRGMITVITLLVLLVIISLSLTTIMNSRMNTSSSDNYKNKIQSFYAADGVITCLAQEMIDSAENHYLVNQIRHQDIGTYIGIAGSYSFNKFTNTDTVCGAGMDIHGKMDDFHYVYRKISGDADISVRVSSLAPGTSALGGIMIRNSLATESGCVSVLWPVASTHNIIFRYRTGDLQSSVDVTGAATLAGVWIRLKRSGSTFTGYQSNDGISWSAVGSITVSMNDSVYAGLAVCSYSQSILTKGVFKNLAGLIRRSYSDSLVLTSAGNTKVKYTINELSSGVFDMVTEGFKVRADGSQIHVAKLNQIITRERTNSFVSGALDSVFLPVTYYDYRADLSNPEFNISYVDNVMKGMVQSNLDADRKPVPAVNNNLRTCLLRWYNNPGNNWYNWTPAQRSTGIDTSNNHRADISTCFSTYLPGFPNHSTTGWWFSDSLNLWFRPSGAPGAIFDPFTGRWSNLKNRPRVSGGPAPNEWVGQNYDSTNRYATIVIYDSLKFREKPKGSGVFVFGDSVYATTVDTQYFVTKCNFPWVTSTYKFMPLKKRGFGFDPARYWLPDPICSSIENYAFTMEMHRKFTYKTGQVFSFTGDDDVWVFINNRLVIDLGGVHFAKSKTVLLDTLGLTQGEEYWFDFFYCERMTVESNIYVTTNMLMFAPPQRSMRNWRRDYGNLD